jgi:nucleotide-binding universal stress UspA family protein
MGKILCATRGGEASYRTQDAAIDLAKARGDQLVFLYVVDLSFLDKTERAVRPDVVGDEMVRMGEFLLAVAQERAAEQGLQTGVLVRQGKVREELIAAIQEEKAHSLVLGRPAEDTGAFQLEALEKLAKDIRAKTGAQVQIV